MIPEQPIQKRRTKLYLIFDGAIVKNFMLNHFIDHIDRQERTGRYSWRHINNEARLTIAFNYVVHGVFFQAQCDQYTPASF